MTVKRPLLLHLLLALLLLAMLPGGLALAQEENVLVIAISGDIETLDPPFSQNQRSNETNLNVYDQFFRYGRIDSGEGYSIADTGTIEGAAVESWTWSDDLSSIVLKIREGATFPKTGRDLTADDFIFWFERAIGTAAGTAWNVNTAGITSWEKTGSHEVTLQFSRPSPWLFFLFRDQSQGPMDAIEAQANATDDDPWARLWLAKNDIGSGEYYVESWEPGVAMVLRANPDYWAGKAFFDQVVLQIVPNSADRALLLREGEVDIATGLSTDELASLEGSEGVNVLSVPTRNQMMLGLNTTMGPTADVRVRQALSYAVPYEDIIEGIFAGKSRVSAGPVPLDGQFHDSSLWPFSYDPEAARALLAEAGYADGFEITLDIASGVSTTEQIAVVLQSAWRDIGVTMNINLQPAAIFADQMGTLEHEAWMRDLLWYVDDAGYTGDIFFKTGAVINWTGYSNAALDAVIDELNVTLDPMKKAELAAEYQRILNNDAPALYLAEMPFEIAMRDDIHGYVQLPDNLLWYWPLYRE